MTTKSATQMAETYGLKSAIAFNKLLVKCGVLLDTNKGYMLADDLRGRSLVSVIDMPYWLPNGIRATKKKAVWTDEGQKYIYQRLARIGILPLEERRDLFAETVSITKALWT